MSETVDLLLALLMAVAALGWLAARLRIAYPILLVIGGLALGLIPGLPRVQVNPDSLLTFVLPPLLFPAALFTSWRDFRANLRPILLLAVGLVLFTTALSGVLVHHFIGLPLATCFVLGAIISPPDAVAATAIADQLKVPRRVVTILEGESLVNDATALVAYQFAVHAVVTGEFSMARAAVRFFAVAAGGILLGYVVGLVSASVHKHLDNPPVEITVTLLTPFVAYVGAERAGASGVLAVVTAGILLGWRTPEITTSSTRLQAGAFWTMIEFLLNGFVFILIGLKLPDAMRALGGESVARLVRDALVVSLAVVLIRIVWVFPASYLPRMLFPSLRVRDPYPSWREVAVVAWTGMRGVVSLAAALALPLTVQGGAEFPGRTLILFLTFVVIFTTLVVQGLSLPGLIRALGFEDDRGLEIEEREARLRANRAALEKLTQSAEAGAAKQDALDRLRIEYEDRIEQIEAYDPRRSGHPHGMFSAEYEALSKEALKVERAVILNLRNERVINDEVLRHVQRDLDLAETRLRRRQ